MKSKWKHFTEEELTCKCGCARQEMDGVFMTKIESMRLDAGFQFIVKSAYRCPDYNDRISSTGKNGPHTAGRAMDIGVSGNKAHALLDLSFSYGMTGAGISQKGDHNSRFIHLDNLTEGTRPWVWSY